MVLGADSAYVIHLDRHELRKKRMDHLIQKLQLQNINYVKAIDRNDYLDDSFNFSKEHFGTNFWDPNGWCTLGILCCALSHRKAWKQFLDSGDEVGLFLEDDVRNTPAISKIDFNKIREELDELNSVNYFWGIAILGRYHKEIIHGKQITENLYRSILHNEQYSGHAYLLNRKSAQWYYDNTEKIKYPADLRLEISPFKQISIDKSIFMQKHREVIIGNLQIEEEWWHSTMDDVPVSKTLGNGFKQYHLNSQSKYMPVLDTYRKNIWHKGEELIGMEFKLNTYL